MDPIQHQSGDVLCANGGSSLFASRCLIRSALLFDLARRLLGAAESDSSADAILPVAAATTADGGESGLKEGEGEQGENTTHSSAHDDTAHTRPASAARGRLRDGGHCPIVVMHSLSASHNGTHSPPTV